MRGEPHGDRDAHGVDHHRRHIARQEAHANHSSSRAGGSNAMKEGECDHRERGDHEVDPRARLLDQEQALAREVAFAGLHRERCACRRTHQLRVHLQKIGHPIVGDPLYGNGKFGDRLYLHALELEITLPDRSRKTFAAPLPPEFNELLK